VITVHCARIAQQFQCPGALRLEIASRFEVLDKHHLGLADLEVSGTCSYFEFLNLAYCQEHLKREHLWMVFRYLAESGEDHHNMITAESLRRRLLMMDWARSCQLRLID